MTDHPVLIPTSFGPVEGVVSEPGETRTALVITHANGRAGRAGTNGVWARTARALAERGVAVLRADYARGIEAGHDREQQALAVWRCDLTVRAEISAWFAESIGVKQLSLVGICRGARVVLHLAARDDTVSRLLLMAPPLIEPAARHGWWASRFRSRSAAAQVRVDPRAEGDLLRVVERVPVTMVCSDSEAAFFKKSLSRRARDLEVIAAPRLNRMESPQVQTAVLEQTVTWGSRALVENALA